MEQRFNRLWILFAAVREKPTFLPRESLDFTLRVMNLDDLYDDLVERASQNPDLPWHIANYLQREVVSSLQVPLLKGVNQQLTSQDIDKAKAFYDLLLPFAAEIRRLPYPRGPLTRQIPESLHTQLGIVLRKLIPFDRFNQLRCEHAEIVKRQENLLGILNLLSQQIYTSVWNRQPLMYSPLGMDGRPLMEYFYLPNTFNLSEEQQKVPALVKALLDQFMGEFDAFHTYVANYGISPHL